MKRRGVEPEPAFVPVIKAFASDRGVTVEKMFHSAGVKAAGKFFAFVARGNLVLKLPKERVSELVARGAGKHFDRNTGKPLKEWISIPPGSGDWVDLAREAREFIRQG